MRLNPEIFDRVVVNSNRQLNYHLVILVLNFHIN